MTAWEFMVYLHKNHCHFMSSERPGQASTSELKRWLNNRAISFNGIALTAEQEVEFPIVSLVLFSNSDKKRITLA